MKERSKKGLSLNKQTIANLDKSEMEQIKGGQEAKPILTFLTSRKGNLCISLISCAGGCH